MPAASVKASDYGVQCNGIHDDTAAIQTAVDTATIVAGGVEIVPPYPRSGGTIQLPQGKCIIHRPIILSNYGSIQGSANGTWLVAAEPWGGTPIDNAMVEIRQSWDKSLYHGQMTSSINRFVRNLNFIYAARVHSITAIKVFNQTGTTNSMPYPAQNTDPQQYQIPGVIIEGVAIYSMDTGIDMEDCGECVIHSSQVFYVKNGLIDGANNYSLVVDDSAIQSGSNSYTSTTGEYQRHFRGLPSPLGMRGWYGSSLQRGHGQAKPDRFSPKSDRIQHDRGSIRCGCQHRQLDCPGAYQLEFRHGSVHLGSSQSDDLARRNQLDDHQQLLHRQQPHRFKHRRA